MSKFFFKYLCFLCIATLLCFTSNASNYTNNTYAQHNVSKTENSTTSISILEDFNSKHLVFEIAESEESENEESCVKAKFSSKVQINDTAFINAILFQNFSNELEKNVFRSPNIITRPRFRLYAQFQVFII